MQLKPDALAGHLARGPLRPIYTVYGDEPLLTQEAADQIRAAARAAGCSERQVFTVSGAHFDWSGVLGAAQSMGLFADMKLIELRIPSGKPGKDGSAALQAYAEQAGEGVITLVHLPRLDRQQLQSGWFGALDQAGATVRVDPVERAALPRWLAQRLAAQGQPVAPDEAGQAALAFFADRVEGNLLAAHQELQKLALLYPPGPLGLDQIEAAVMDVARYESGQLTGAVLAGQTGRALRMLDALKASGESAVLVHILLSADLRALRDARAAVDAGQPLPMALRQARVWGDKERVFERLVPGLTTPRLDRLVAAASVCDGLIKGLRHPDWPTDPWDGLRRLVLLTLEVLLASQAGRAGQAGRLALRT